MYFHFKKLHSFTSVEMLIIIFIVIGLSALTISTFQKNSFVAKDDLRKKDLKEITRVVDEYKKSSGKYFDPYPEEDCLGENSYKIISTRNTTFRDAVKSYFTPDDLNLPKENYLYVVSCSMEDYGVLATLDKNTETGNYKDFLNDYLTTLNPAQRKNTYILPQ